MTVKKHIARSGVLALALSLAGCGSMPSGNGGATGWQVLFDGSDLADWTPTGNANWRIVDGAVEATSGNGLLVSNAAYKDFQVTVEFWVSPEANSGVFARCADPSKIADTTCYEVNIFDKRPDQTYRTGGIVRVAPPAQKLDAGGRWNTYDITARGTHLVVKLNGVQTVDVNDSKFTDGYIALQAGGGVVKFKNVRIRKLDAN